MLRFLNGHDNAALLQHVLMVSINSRAGFTILVYGLGYSTTVRQTINITVSVSILGTMSAIFASL
jgi:hypothetical protein